MPDRISVRSFLNEAREDVSSPTTSNFMSTMNACRNTVGALEEVSEWGNEFRFLKCLDFCFSVDEVPFSGGEVLVCQWFALITEILVFKQNKVRSINCGNRYSMIANCYYKHACTILGEQL